MGVSVSEEGKDGGCTSSPIDLISVGKKAYIMHTRWINPLSLTNPTQCFPSGHLGVGIPPKQTSLTFKLPIRFPPQQAIFPIPLQDQIFKCGYHIPVLSCFVLCSIASWMFWDSLQTWRPVSSFTFSTKPVHRRKCFFSLSLYTQVLHTQVLLIILPTCTAIHCFLNIPDLTQGRWDSMWQ